jgi:hypothetical protein
MLEAETLDEPSAPGFAAAPASALALSGRLASNGSMAGRNRFRDGSTMD